MSTKTSRKKSSERYEEKRKKTPRFGGYLTTEEKEIFLETKLLGNFESEKEMIIAAVGNLNKKLS